MTVIGFCWRQVKQPVGQAILFRDCGSEGLTSFAVATAIVLPGARRCCLIKFYAQTFSKVGALTLILEPTANFTLKSFCSFENGEIVEGSSNNLNARRNPIAGKT